MIGLFQYYRIVAAYLVLLMHQQFWGTGAFLGGVKNAAVPLFAIMAGYLAVGDWWLEAGECGEKVSVVKEMVGKKVRRILVPYAIWAVIYVLANNVVLDVLVKGESFSMPGCAVGSSEGLQPTCGFCLGCSRPLWRLVLS